MFTYTQISQYLAESGLSDRYDTLTVWEHMDSWRRLGPSQMGKPCSRGWVGLKGACKRAKHHGGDKEAAIKSSKLALADKIRKRKGMKTLGEKKIKPIEVKRKAKPPSSMEKDKAAVIETLSMIKNQLGLNLALSENFTGMQKHKGKKYFNVDLNEKTSESQDYAALERFAQQYKLISIEPNGVRRVAIYINNKPKKTAKTIMTSPQYTKPRLRDRIKARITAGSKGGKAGQWSMRKAQLVAAAYEKAGGGYKGERSETQKSAQK